MNKYLKKLYHENTLLFYSKTKVNKLRKAIMKCNLESEK